MDIAKLANEIGNLRYQTAYQFDFGKPFHQTLSEGDLRGVLAALESRGFKVVHNRQPHVESPSLYSDEHQENQMTL